MLLDFGTNFARMGTYYEEYLGHGAQQAFSTMSRWERCLTHERDIQTGHHASGHASRDDLTEMVRTIDPEIIIPVHTEYATGFEQVFGGERTVVLPTRGEKIPL